MQTYLINNLIKFLIRFLKYYYYICDMKETRKQKEIRLRRKAVYSAYLATELSTTDFVYSMARKFKISSVTIYSDLKFSKNEEWKNISEQIEDVWSDIS